MLRKWHRLFTKGKIAAGRPVDGEYEPEKYGVPQFNNVDLDVLGLFTSRTETRRPVKFSLDKLKS